MVFGKLVAAVFWNLVALAAVVFRNVVAVVVAVMAVVVRNVVAVVVAVAAAAGPLSWCGCKELERPLGPQDCCRKEVWAPL